MENKILIRIILTTNFIDSNIFSVAPVKKKARVIHKLSKPKISDEFKF